MSEEWQYYDSTTIKINGDLTSKYWENQVVTITQSSQTKYFEIISVELSSGDTLLHLNGGGLYTLTNDTITSHYYSMYAAPQGLPNVFTRNILYRYIPHSLATAENDFLVASGSGTFTKKTLAETKNVLGINGCIPHSLATAENDFLVASGSGTFTKKTLAETKNVLGINGCIPHSLATAENDFLVASGSGTFTKKTLAETKNVLGINGCVPIDGWIPAGETWTYASADSPTFTFTISGDKTTKYYPGMRLKLTHSSTTKYFIVTKVSYSSPNTTVTVYGGTDYTLASSAITNPYYSMMKAPAGFPLDPLKWTVSLINTTIYEQSNPVKEQWYNLGSLSIYIPIGAWRVDFWVVAQALQPSAAAISLNAALSTSTSSATDSDLKMLYYLESCTGYIGLITKGKYLNLSSKTRYYVIESCNGTNISKLYCNGASSATKVMAVCAYL